MKNLILSLLVFFFLSSTYSQDVHLSIFGGMGNYQGDLQDKKFTLNQAQAAFGAGILYEVTDNWYLRANFTYGKVSANDKKGINQDRNLSFSSPIYDLHLGVEYDLLNNYEHSLAPFLFAGLSGFYFNPSAIDAKGNQVFLQPLGTEGQGFYLDRKPYSLTQIAIPFGGGIKLAINDNIRFRVEVGMRKLFTDYLDDVSTTFADKATLLAQNGAKAVEMAFRSGELKPALTYPAAGNKRGNPSSKDWYYFSTIGLSFRIVSSPDKSHLGKSNYGCPKNLF